MKRIKPQFSGGSQLPFIVFNEKYDAMDVTLADRMEVARREAGMSKADLARRSGCTQQNIGQLASGTNRGNVTPETLFALADALGVHARWLALGTGPRKQSERVDTERLEEITVAVFSATEGRGTEWTVSQRVRLAVRLYDVWCKTGGMPDIAMAVRLFREPLSKA